MYNAPLRAQSQLMFKIGCLRMFSMCERLKVRIQYVTRVLPNVLKRFSIKCPCRAMD